MPKFKYILKSFLYFKKQHLAVLAGTIITTAVEADLPRELLGEKYYVTPGLVKKGKS